MQSYASNDMPKLPILCLIVLEFVILCTEQQALLSALRLFAAKF
jgi:hypothetical protein